MKQRQTNRIKWYLLGLAALLITAALLGSTGITLARYRAQREESILFSARAPEAVYLGTLTDEDADGIFTFDAEGQGGWITADGQTRLDFAVANGISDEKFAAGDMLVRLRLIGSLGFWNGTEPVVIKLAIPWEDDPTQYDLIEATATRIHPESPLYSTFGDGWVFSFLDEEGEEVSLMLEGGTHSYMGLRLTLEGTEITDNSLLQLQVSGELIRD